MKNKATTTKTKKPKAIKKKNNTAKKLPSILGTPMAYEYLRTNPVTEEMINYVCEQLLEYARCDETTFVAGFLRKMRIPRQTFYNWSKKFPKLQEAISEAKFLVGYNRMDGAIKKRFDRGSILHSQYRFGDEWGQDDTHQAEMKKAADNEEEKVINVYTTPIEKVIDRKKYVPHKREDKE